MHGTGSLTLAAALLHPSIVSRLAVTILSAPTIALNAVGLALCIIRCGDVFRCDLQLGVAGKRKRGLEAADQAA